MVVLSGAEADALRQIRRRYGDDMNGFERDVLTQLVKKIESKEEEARLSNQAWRRFVWTDEDIQILRSAGEAPGVMDVTTDMPLPEQQRALMEHIDEVLREAGY